MWTTLLMILLFFVAIVLILLILVQRGKGGGLAGALGGPGGQSAFGAKAGDAFTRITIIVASIWIVLCMLAAAAMRNPGQQKLNLTTPTSATAPASTEDVGDGATDGATGESSAGATESTAETDAPPAESSE